MQNHHGNPISGFASVACRPASVALETAHSSIALRLTDRTQFPGMQLQCRSKSKTSRICRMTTSMQWPWNGARYGILHMPASESVFFWLDTNCALLNLAPTPAYVPDILHTQPKEVRASLSQSRTQPKSYQSRPKTSSTFMGRNLMEKVRARGASCRARRSVRVRTLTAALKRRAGDCCVCLCLCLCLCVCVHVCVSIRSDTAERGLCTRARAFFVAEHATCNNLPPPHCLSHNTSCSRLRSRAGGTRLDGRPVRVQDGIERRNGGVRGQRRQEACNGVGAAC